MKRNRISWTAEDHRLYLETWLSGLSNLVIASGKPLTAMVMIVALLTGQPQKLLHILISLL